MDAVLRAVDKEFSLPANYPKGHGNQFKYWLHKYHPGVLLVAVERTSGSRQDLAVQGAAAIYWNRKYYVEFLNQRLQANGDNILQNNLFIVLSYGNDFYVLDLCHFPFMYKYAYAVVSWQYTQTTDFRLVY